MEDQNIYISKGHDRWNIFWKWHWFKKDQWRKIYREREDIQEWSYIFNSIFRKYEVNNILDCSCGVGCKTIVLAERGYHIEGSDGSSNAILYARELSKEEGFDINFFQSTWEELGKKVGNKYSCIINDAFHYIPIVDVLKAAAKGIYSSLEKGGIFVFFGASEGFNPHKREQLVEEKWRGVKELEVDEIYEKTGLKLITVSSNQKKTFGILGDIFFIIKDQNGTRIEITPNLPVYCYKWVWNDYVNILKEVGFSQVFSMKLEGASAENQSIPNIAIK